MIKNTVKTDLGMVRISDEAVAEIATLAALKVPGVAGMGALSGMERFAELLGVKGPGAGVSVEMGAREIGLRLALLVEFGSDIADVALQTQDEVSRAVEKMTGLEVRQVDVTIQGVRSGKARP